MLTGSSWTQEATFWTGKADDQICKLCMKEKETSDHVWFCESLRENAGDLDEELANIYPMDLAPAVRHGIAPIMNANPTKTFWRAPCKEKRSKEQKKFLGCWHKNRIAGEVKKLIENAEPEHSARAVMQIMTTTLGTGRAKTEEEKRPWASS